MKLQGYKEAYEFNSSKTSELVNQFAFAGIAVIWIFRGEKSIQPIATAQMFMPLLFMVVTLVITFFQYFLLTIFWWRFYRNHEKELEHNSDKDYKASKIYSNVGWAFFFLKSITLLIGYAYIILFVYKHIA